MHFIKGFIRIDVVIVVNQMLKRYAVDALDVNFS